MLVCKLACKETRKHIDEYLQYQLFSTDKQHKLADVTDLLFHMLETFEEDNQKYLDLIFAILESENSMLIECIMKKMMTSLNSLKEEIIGQMIHKNLHKILKASLKNCSMKINLLYILIFYVDKLDSKLLLKVLCQLSLKFRDEHFLLKPLVMDLCYCVYAKFLKSVIFCCFEKYYHTSLINIAI